MIEDTTQRDPLLHLLGAMSEGSSGYITGMEAAGQRQLVASAILPIESSGDAEFEKLGFTFGAKTDDLFREATLPEGWSKQPSDHSMWSHIVDQLGRRRVAIFYKAAFYDRKAFMHLETPLAYLRNALYEKTEPVLDDNWLTAAVVDETLAGERDRRLADAKEAIGFAHRPDLDGDYWAKRAAEYEVEAADIENTRLRFAAKAA